MATTLKFAHRKATPGKEKGLMILLHGLGSNEADLFGLSPYVDEGFDFYSLRAPQDYFGGYKWFSLEIGAAGVTYDLDEARTSMALVSETIKNLQTHHGTSPEITVIGGFSQGAIMSTALLLTDPDLAGQAWLMSGACIPELIPGETVRYGRAPRALVQHGLYDEVIPIQRGKDAAAILGAALGATVEFLSYPMAHSISEESLKDAAVWLAKQ